MLFLFIILVVTVPFLYRMINLGQFSSSVDQNQNAKNSNYKKAEMLRSIQVLLGFSFFVYHGILFWGIGNTICLIIFITLFTMLAEVIGSKSGIIFGGKYEYIASNTQGYTFRGVPLLIPIAWYGIIYMGLNSYFLLMKVPPSVFYNSFRLWDILLVAVMIVILDVVLDPIAVDEKRWRWNEPGIYYGVPILNFFGWFCIVIAILAVYVTLFPKFNFIDNDESFMMKYAPGMLFVLLHLISARPCFERRLYVSGYLGICFSLVYIVTILSKYGII